jgi:hypothetical protein
MMPECTFAVQSTIDYYFNQGNLVTWSMHTVSALNTDTSDSKTMLCDTEHVTLKHSSEKRPLWSADEANFCLHMYKCCSEPNDRLNLYLF